MQNMRTLINTTPSQTMTSKQIADVVDSRHDSVKRTVDRLAEKGVISQPPMVDGEKSANGVIEKLYMVNERDSYVVVAQLCPEYTAKLVDYWMATKNQIVQPLALPLTYKEALLALVQAEEDKERLAIERDHAIATKAEIGNRREATAMATASHAVRKANTLQAELGRCKSHATIIAIENATRDQYQWQPLKKWCKDRAIKPIEVVDPRWGKVKSWPAQAWLEVYGVNIAALF
jgi:phage regulator Rha-like protein